MYDSVNLWGIPKPLPPHSIVAYYLDGPYAVASVAEVVAEFPGVSLNPIDVNASRGNYARTLDVESGDATPTDCERWLDVFKAWNPHYGGGARGILYSSVDTLPAIRVGTGPYLLGRDYYLWPATGDGSVVTPELLRARFPQYRWPDNCLVGCQNIWSRTFDSSVIFGDDFLPD